MQPGRRPLPTVLKVLRGTDRPDRLPKDEPKPRVRIPKPPPNLNAVALAEYWKMGKILRKMRILTEADGVALAAYATTYSRWKDAHEKVDAHGTVGKMGKIIIQSPYLSIENRANAELRKWLTEFGCTPSARSRVDASPQHAGGVDDF